MSDMKVTHVIVQARMGATRLPGKVLEEFTHGYSFLEWIVERAKLSSSVHQVIVATTTNEGDDRIVELCERQGYEFMRGSEDDVLQRYVDATKKFGGEIIVRVTADNPLVDIMETDRLIETLVAEQLDYASNHPAGLPLGTGSEVFTIQALMRAAKEAKDSYEREHVTPHLYRNPELFKQRNVAPVVVHPFASKVRLTLDTPQDMEFLRLLSKEMGLVKPGSQPSTGEILTYLEHHPNVVAINSSIEQKTFPQK